MDELASRCPLVTCPLLVLSRIAQHLDWPGILRLRRCSSAICDAIEEAASGLPAYLQLAALLEREAASSVGWSDWDIVAGMVAGRLRTADLPAGSTCAFSLDQSNEDGSGNSEDVDWEVISMPLPNAPSSAEAQRVTFGAFSHSGHIRRYEDHMHDMQITAEISGKLPTTVIYQLHRHAGDGDAGAEGQQCFAELANLLEVSEATVVQQLAAAFHLFKDLRDNEKWETALAEKVRLGELTLRDGAADYANAMGDLAQRGISPHFETLDRVIPQRRRGLLQLLQRKVWRLYAESRTAGFARIYRALCSEYADALAAETIPEIDPEEWIANSVIFTKCCPDDRLSGIEYGISGNPSSARFQFREPLQNEGHWRSPTFAINFEDGGSGYSKIYERSLSLTCLWDATRPGKLTSKANKRVFAVDSAFSDDDDIDDGDNVFAMDIASADDSDVSTLLQSVKEEKIFVVTEALQQQLWQQCDPGQVWGGPIRFFAMLVALSVSVAMDPNYDPEWQSESDDENDSDSDEWEGCDSNLDSENGDAEEGSPSDDGHGRPSDGGGTESSDTKA
ncbi:hypothetical protein BDZ88DRAFT_510927 [Geranomyces variabilis]|nr:hypothetical protein BDZ88DRAFT_510927 [Geranomyces variabilis]KAJ3131186.1 hypothetical protein HDU90_008672 [Geranomyces variabilis]